MLGEEAEEPGARFRPSQVLFLRKINVQREVQPCLSLWGLLPLNQYVAKWELLRNLNRLHIFTTPCQYCLHRKKPSFILLLAWGIGSSFNSPFLPIDPLGS